MTARGAAAHADLRGAGDRRRRADRLVDRARRARAPAARRIVLADRRWGAGAREGAFAWRCVTAMVGRFATPIASSSARRSAQRGDRARHRACASAGAIVRTPAGQGSGHRGAQTRAAPHARLVRRIRSREPSSRDRTPDSPACSSTAGAFNSVRRDGRRGGREGAGLLGGPRIACRDHERRAS